MAQCPKLRELRLTSCYRITGTGLGHLAPLTCLTSLNLMHCRAIMTLDALVALSSLCHLSVEACAGLGDAGCAVLANLPALTSLDMRCCTELTDDMAIALGPALLSRLHALYLGCCPLIGDAFFGALEAAPASNLTMLHLRDCVQITDLGLAHISRLGVKRLNLAGLCRITDAGLAMLASLQMTVLSLKCCSSITSGGVARLMRGQQEVEWLDLCMNQQVEDEAVGALAHMRTLHTLRIRYNGVTDLGLATLAAGHLKALRLLNVEQCAGVTDGAVGSMLNLPGIQTVYLAGSGMTDQAALALRNAGVTPFRAIIENYHEVDVW